MPSQLKPERSARAYLDFIGTARAQLMNEQWGALTGLGQQAIEKYEAAQNTRADDLGSIREALFELPVMSSFFRIKRSLQEATWQRLLDAFQSKQDKVLDELKAAEDMGPGTVSWNPDFVYPEYAKVDIHIQPGGYTQHPLAGLIYDLGTQVFFGGGNVDLMHAATANLTPGPKDEQVTRVVDLGCSVGQMTCAMKKKYPDAEVTGVDISGPMVRYAHWRAVKQNCDVHFSQQSASELDLPDDHVDLVVAHILFHEIPVDIIRATVLEAFRVLRPGGSLVIWDFPTATDDNPSFGNFMGMMDAADNGEPFAIDFVRCGVEDMIREAGFKLRTDAADDVRPNRRVADKPSEAPSTQ